MKPVLPAALLSCLTIFSAALPAADQLVRRSDRAVLRGEFTAMTVASLTIKLQNGQTQEVPVSDVATVRFDMEPPTLSQALAAERGGSLASALTSYKQIQLEYGGDDKRLVTDLKFLIARTQVRLAMANPAEVPAAAKAISAFRTENPNNFRFLEASLLEADLLSQDPAQAEAARGILTKVQESPVKGFALQAGVQLGMLLLKSKDTPAALAAFDKVIADSQNDPNSVSALYDGQLGKSLCLKADGKADEAITILDDVIAKASESETRTLARAWLLKGDSFREKNQAKDALMSYLHVDILYGSEPSEHAEALYHLSALWGPAGHQNRADDARAVLQSKYPNSQWAKR
ncbi:MAG: tetratricopeptide repeat protein [Planctomycetota bacterium]